MNSSSVCIRCGNVRIASKSWEETIAGSVVTITTTVCPDEACQKIVESQLQQKKDKLEAIHNESMKRREESRRNRSHKKPSQQD